MPELSVYAYPWDVAQHGVDQFVDWAARSGVDRVAVAAAYHSAEVIAPRGTSQVHVRAEANVSHLPLPPRETTDALALPPGRLAREQPQLFAAVARIAHQAGVRLTGWVVTLHNSDLASRVPSAAIANCFGDPSTHGLCPGNPDVRGYAVDLVRAVARTGYFDELMVESLSYLLAGHGHPHELWGVRMDPLCRALASLCFCGHCVDRATAEGIDAEVLRQWVADTLHRLWNSPAGGLRVPDEGAELAAVVVARPDLAAYCRMRCAVVTELLAESAAAVRAEGVALAAGGPVWARPLPFSWLEGIDLEACARIADRVVLMPYYEEIAAVVRDVDFARAVAPTGSFQVLQTLWPQHHAGRLSTLLDKVAATASAGIDQFGLYNFSTAPAPALDWVRAVARAVHET